MKKNKEYAGKFNCKIQLVNVLFVSLLLQSLTCFSQTKTNGPYPIVKDGKYSFIDKNGKPLFDLAGRPGAFSDGMAFFVDNDLNQLGYIDTAGKIVIAPAYKVAAPFSEGLAAVNVDDEWGFIDKKGNMVIKPTFAFALRFCEGVCRVKESNSLLSKWGFIDKNGNWLIKPAFDNAGDFNEGMALIEINGKYGYINKTGDIVIKPEYDYGAVVINEGHNFYLEGKFSQGKAAVLKNEKWGYIDKTGKIIIPFRFDYAGNFAEGLAPVAINGKYGYIDSKGTIVIPLQYSMADIFSEGLGTVHTGTITDGKWGFIDSSGKMIIQPTLNGILFSTEPYAFHNGVLYTFFEGQKWGYINKTGAILWKHD